MGVFRVVFVRRAYYNDHDYDDNDDEMIILLHMIPSHISTTPVRNP